MTARMKKGVLQANGETMAEPTMAVENVARAVVYMASLPLDANVLTLTVMATNMPFVGAVERGHALVRVCSAAQSRAARRPICLSKLATRALC